MMYEYTPKYAPEITLHYLIIAPGEPYSFSSPPVGIDIDICFISVHGKLISGWFQSVLLGQHDDWLQKILAEIKNKRMVA